MAVLVIMLIDLSRARLSWVVISPTAVAAMLMVHHFYMNTENHRASQPSSQTSQSLCWRLSTLIISAENSFSLPVYCTDEIGVRVKLS